MKSIKDYFNKESKKGKYIQKRITIFIEQNSWEISQIIDNLPKNAIFLDMGCGAGTLLNYLSKKLHYNIVCGLDISENMIAEAKINSSDGNVLLLLGSATNLPYRNKTIDYIYCESLLHHIVSNNRRNSMNMVKRAFMEVKEKLKPSGFFLLKELYYESHILENISSKLIFYILKISENLNLKLPINEAEKGLLVSFYTRNELLDLIKKLNGDILKVNNKKWSVGIKEKIFLLKERGQITYLIKFY